MYTTMKSVWTLWPRCCWLSSLSRSDGEPPPARPSVVIKTDGRLNATSDPAEQLTFSTHLVHPGIIAAGDIWARNGGAKKIIIQGEPLPLRTPLSTSLIRGSLLRTFKPPFRTLPIYSYRRIPLPEPIGSNAVLPHSRRDTLSIPWTWKNFLWIGHSHPLDIVVHPRVEHDQAQARQ